MSELRQRVEPIRSKALRRAAAGQRCTLNLPNICCYEAETVVLAHIHDEQFGKSQKADDTSGFHACRTCHAAYDLHTHGLPPEVMLELVLRAYQRTIRRLVQMGEMRITLDRVTPLHAKEVPPRLPPALRAKVPPSRQLQSANNWPTGRTIPTRPKRATEPT